MPERLDRVLVQLASRGEPLEMPRDSRDKLLDEIRHLDSAQGIRDAFAAVGASRPVELKRTRSSLLVQAIDVWMGNVGGPDRLPTAIHELRNALIDDMHDARSR